MSVLPETWFSFTTLKHAGIGTLVSQMNLGSLYNTAWHPLSFGLNNMFLNKQSFLVVILKRRKIYISNIHNCCLFQITVVLQCVDCISILIGKTISTVFDASLNGSDGYCFIFKEIWTLFMNRKFKYCHWSCFDLLYYNPWQRMCPRFAMQSLNPCPLKILAIIIVCSKLFR